MLACKSNALRCRLFGIAREVTLRTDVRHAVPGGIITVIPTKQWTVLSWRLGNAPEAAAIFRKMLWLNPSDNQGARFDLAAIEAGKTWEELEGEA